MMKINQITKKFGSFVAINNICLEIEKPGLYVLVGANGSGKTTLFNIINGSLIPDSGKLYYESDLENRKSGKNIGISTEPFSTEPSLSIIEIAEICCTLKKSNQAEIEKWLTFWDLKKFKEKQFATLSTGMKKRLSLALSLFGNPDFLLWDEPFSGLDPIGIEMLNQLVSDLLEQKKFIFLSTHLLKEIQAENLYFFVLSQGKLAGTVTSDTPNFKEKILILLKYY